MGQLAQQPWGSNLRTKFKNAMTQQPADGELVATGSGSRSDGSSGITEYSHVPRVRAGLGTYRAFKMKAFVNNAPQGR